jgi:uncharacterized protein YgbK (DUF1537 family)
MSLRIRNRIGTIPPTMGERASTSRWSGELSGNPELPVSSPAGASGAIDEHELLASYAPPQVVSPERLATAAAGARRVVVLDDDPTGTQTVADMPVVTAWESEDIRWALRQGTAGFFVLTNTRSLDETAAARRNSEVLDTLMAVAAEERLKVTLVSRSDSTLRGHFPLETDVLTDRLRAHGVRVDGVVLIPAFTDAGRITVDSTHWVRTANGMVRASDTEFARDPEFGYRAGTLPESVAEKSQGRWRSEQVARITLDRLRGEAPAAIAAELGKLRHGRPAVVDAASEEDLRVFALAAIEAERRGTNLLYRTGPSFVRSRLGQDRHRPISDKALENVLAGSQSHASADRRQEMSAHGLVVAGSYVDLTTQQLEVLSAVEGITQFTLDVPAMRAERASDDWIESLASAVADALRTSDVVLATSRTRLKALNEEASRAIQAEVSASLVNVAARAIARRRPRWVVAKGGITSSDVATEALNIRRAWVRGTLLPGIVSLWEPANPTAQRVPYVVFAGNVGDAESLSAVVNRLRRGS